MPIKNDTIKYIIADEIAIAASIAHLYKNEVVNQSMWVDTIYSGKAKAILATKNFMEDNAKRTQKGTLNNLHKKTKRTITCKVKEIEIDKLRPACRKEVCIK